MPMTLQGRAGIPRAWRVDLVNASIIEHADAGAHGYRSFRALDAESTIDSARAALDGLLWRARASPAVAPKPPRSSTRTLPYCPSTSPDSIASASCHAQAEGRWSVVPRAVLGPPHSGRARLVRAATDVVFSHQQAGEIRMVLTVRSSLRYRHDAVLQSRRNFGDLWFTRFVFLDRDVDDSCIDSSFCR